MLHFIRPDAQSSMREHLVEGTCVRGLFNAGVHGPMNQSGYAGEDRHDEADYAGSL